MAKHKPDDRNAAEKLIDSLRQTGRASGETGGPDDNGPDVDYSDMGNINVDGDDGRGRTESPGSRDTER